MGQRGGGIAGSAGRPGGAVGPIAGAGVVASGFGLLVRERSLWGLSLVPILFSLVAVAAAVTAVVHFAGPIDDRIDALWPVLEASAWYAWLWVGPGRAFFWLLGVLVFALVAAGAVVLAILLASIAAAPFLDALAHRVERLETGRVIESEESGVGAFAWDVGRSIVGEVRRLSFFLVVAGVLFAVGFVVPGAHLVTGPLMLGVTLLFLPLEYAGYVLDRRRLDFAARRRWVVARWPKMLGFGSAAFVVCFVPGLNLLVIPALVTAGTLLVVRDPPPEVGPGIVVPG